MQKGLVSVIIPTRNRAHFIKDAIDSVYAQSYSPFEIIVVDDGGTDSTQSIIEQYDSRLYYIRQEHLGAAAARNHGISLAKGEFIAFLDDDDFFAPEKLEKNVHYLNEHPATHWLCSGFSFVDAEGKPLPRPAIILPQSELTPHDIALFSFFNSSSVMARKTAIDKAGGYPEGVRISEDYHLWAKLVLQSNGGVLQESLLSFRQHPRNTPLPFRELLRENTRIIDFLLSQKAEQMQPRVFYIHNLQCIIGDSLKYKKKYWDYACFKLAGLIK